MIEKAKCIFNTIIDAGSAGPTVADILTHVQKTEENWEKFPKTEAEIKVITADKLISHYSKCLVAYF